MGTHYGARLTGNLPSVPISLFRNNVQGAWYDPSDFSTLFQDSAGTTPVTAVEQPVGLMLDRSRGLVLGSELVVNGSNLVNTTGWTPTGSATLAAVGGALELTTLNPYEQARQNITTVVGRSYKITFTTGTPPSDFVYADFAGTASKLINTAGTYSFIATATSTSTVLALIFGDGFGTVYFSNISVRELPGNHALQATSASRPVLRARYNLLTYSEQFDNAGWGKLNSTVTANASVAPDGTTTADRGTATATPGYPAYQSIAAAATTYNASIYAKADGASQFRLDFVTSAFANGASCVFTLTGNGSAGAITHYGSSSGFVASITSVGNGWYRCSLQGAATATNWFHEIALLSSGDTVFFWGAQLLTSADQTATGGAYQRIAAATDYDVSNPVWRPYLAFDGVDDSFGTSSIDFSGTDEVTLFAGVTKLSDAAFELICELTTTVDGFADGMALFGANQAGYYFQTGAPFNRVFGPGFPPPIDFATAAPTTDVVSVVYDRTIASSTSQIQYRIDGQGPSSASLTLEGVGASGAFANAPLFIGRRNNTSFPLNARLYGFAVLGRTATAAELSAMETWVAGKTGVTL